MQILFLSLFLLSLSSFELSFKVRVFIFSRKWNEFTILKPTVQYVTFNKNNNFYKEWPGL